MNDAKDGEKTTPEATKTRVSNEQLLDKIESLTVLIESMHADIEELKVKAGYRDKAVAGKPEKTNFNDDPGPWQKRPVYKTKTEEAVDNYNKLLHESLQKVYTLIIYFLEFPKSKSG